MIDAPPPPWKPAPVVHESPATPQAGPLDLASASLGQDGTELQLTITTRGSFQAARLSHRGPRGLCVRLSYGPRVALCVAGTKTRPILRRVPLEPPGPAERITATVTVEKGKLTAAFTPADADLPRGAFRWSVESRWDGGGDRLPDHGAFDAKAKLLALPDCFGAAALDAAHPCSNPALRTVVTPTPEDAVLLPGWPCAQMRSSGIVFPCSFGVTAARARDTVALVGDSHAEHWRAALEVVAQAKRWRGINLTRSGCPFNSAQVIVDNRADMPRCTRWNREARQWFRDHPEVHTVFVSAHRGASFEGDAVAGYRAAWHALPRSVRRIYVLRDTPRVAVLQTDCVTHMLRAKRPFTPCAEPRAVELPHDPEAEAARGPVDHRVRVLDLTDHICGPAVCSAVVGGVLVLKDEGHLTRTFSTTLGPYLLRALG